MVHSSAETTMHWTTQAIPDQLHVFCILKYQEASLRRDWSFWQLSCNPRDSHACGLVLFLVITSNWFLVCSSTSSGKRTSRSNSWCDKAPGLSESQRKLCKRVPGLQIAIKKGIEKGISECEREFKWNRWNCTLLGEKSLLQRAPGESLKAVVKQLNPVYINSKICFHRQL